MQSKKEKKFWKGAKWVVSILIVGGIFAGLSYYDVFFIAQKAYGLAKEYRAAGLPWEGADLDRGLADSDNGATVYYSAMRLAGGRISQVKGSVYKTVRELQSASKTDKMVLDSTLDELVRMSTFKGLDFHRDWDAGPNVLFFEYSELKSGCRYLGLRATNLGQNRDLRARLADLRAAFKIGEMVGEEPLLLAALVGIDIEREALENAIALAAMNAGDVEWVGAVEREVARWESKIDVTEKIRAEMFHSLASCRVYTPRIGERITLEVDFSTYVSKHPMATDGIPDRIESRAMMARVLPIYLEWDRILKEHPNEIRQALQLCDEYADSVMRRGHTYTEQYSFLFLPVIGGSARAFLEVEFKMKATQEVLRGMEVRAKTGDWPLDAGNGVVDPYSGGSAKVWIEGDKLGIYSVGQDGVDDRKSENWGINGFSREDDVLVTSKP